MVGMNRSLSHLKDPEDYQPGKEKKPDSVGGPYNEDDAWENQQQLEGTRDENVELENGTERD